MLWKGLSWSRQKQAELDFKEQYNMVINRVKLIFLFLVRKLTSFYSFSEEQNITKWERRSLQILISVYKNQKGYKRDFSFRLIEHSTTIQP